MGPGNVVLSSHLPRYLEQARWVVFEAPEFPLVGKILGGVVRAQTIAIDDDLRFGDAITVTSWLARVGRTSFDFGQRVDRAGGGRVAVARCTIVHLGPTGPAPLDPELAAHAKEGDAPAHAATAAVPAADAFAHGFVVRPSDTDTFSHVNQARYVDYVDDARILAARAEHPAGAPGRLRAITVEYLRETKAGDAVVARIARAGDGESRAFELTRGDEVLSRATARFG